MASSHNGNGGIRVATPKLFMPHPYLRLTGAVLVLCAAALTVAAGQAGASLGANYEPVGAVQTLVTNTGIPYSVQLTAVIDPATGKTPTFDVPPSGTRFVAAEFTITNKGSAVYTNDSNDDASLVGSNNQEYTFTASPVSQCTNFDYGVVKLQPGASLSGCVNFAVPNGVNVSRVQWGSTAGFGGAVQWTNTAPPPGPTSGYHEVASDGGMFTFGNAVFHGSMGGKPLNAPIVAMATDPATGGYWEVASDGGIFAFTAPFHGSMGGLPLNAPIVGMASTPTGGGYWEVASDGGIFSFGNAVFHGSMGGKPLNEPIVAIAATPTGGGYWEVAKDGGIFTFGTAQFHGSMGGHPLNQPIVGMAADPATGGYWEVATDGGMFAFTAPFYGSMGGHPLNAPVVGMAATATGGGYHEVASDGGMFTFGNAQFYGSMGGHPLNAPIVGMATT